MNLKLLEQLDEEELKIFTSFLFAQERNEAPEKYPLWQGADKHIQYKILTLYLEEKEGD